MREYLKGYRGEKSSKRLAFIFGIINAMLMSWVTLCAFLQKNKNDLALDLVISVFIAIVRFIETNLK